MIYATKIKMNPEYPPPWRCQDIETIYLEGEGKNQFYKIEEVFYFLRDDQETICVDEESRAELQSVQGFLSTKYVRSKSYDTEKDPLLKLPKQ